MTKNNEEKKNEHLQVFHGAIGGLMAMRMYISFHHMLQAFLAHRTYIYIYITSRNVPVPPRTPVENGKEQKSTPPWASGVFWGGGQG